MRIRRSTTKNWNRESVMQGEGVSTPYIHRTRWNPFSSKCVCIFGNLSVIKATEFVYYYFEFGTVLNRVPTYSLVQWESQNSVVPLKKVLIGCIDFIRKIVRFDISNTLN